MRCLTWRAIVVARFNQSQLSLFQFTEAVVCCTRQGDLLGEMTAMTRRQGSPVTAICADEDCNIIVTGDHSKFVFRVKSSITRASPDAIFLTNNNSTCNKYNIFY